MSLTLPPSADLFFPFFTPIPAPCLVPQGNELSPPAPSSPVLPPSLGVPLSPPSLPLGRKEDGGGGREEGGGRTEEGGGWTEDGGRRRVVGGRARGEDAASLPPAAPEVRAARLPHQPAAVPMRLPGSRCWQPCPGSRCGRRPAAAWHSIAGGPGGGRSVRATERESRTSHAVTCLCVCVHVTVGNLDAALAAGAQPPRRTLTCAPALSETRHALLRRRKMVSTNGISPTRHALPGPP
jgi:hypothetical protein